MKVLLAGASGAIGTPLTRQLVAAGHDVVGLTRDPVRAAGLRADGAAPLIADALDRQGLLRAVDGLTADAVIHELTALRAAPRRHRGMALTDRLRTEGSANLVAAARSIGATRFITQSMILGYGYRDHGDQTLDEHAAFAPPGGGPSEAHIAAMRAAEAHAFSMPHGVALRYGLFYGGDMVDRRALLMRRALPVARGGLLGWVHHDDAAAATVAALEHGRAGHAYNVVDDEPATWHDVFTTMAAALGAPPPRRLPRWVFRLVAPYVATFAIDTSMRVANQLAADELGWRPSFPTFRDGIAAMAASWKQQPATLR